MRTLTHLLSRYRIALSVTALAFLGTLLFTASSHRIPFVLFIAAVVVSSLQGGLRPGLLATCLSALALGLEYRFLSPAPPEGDGDYLPLWLMFVFVGLLSSYLGEQCRRAAETVPWVHATLSSLGDAVIFADAKGHVTFLNPAAAVLTGWKPEEAVGKTIEQVYRTLDEETRQPVENPATKVIREGKSIVRAGPTLLIPRSGTERKHIDTRTSAIRDPRGQLLGVILTFHDISERRQADLADRKHVEKEVQRLRALLTAAQEADQECAHRLAEQKRSEEALQRLLAEAQSQLQERTAEVGRLNLSLREAAHARDRIECALRETQEQLQTRETERLRASELHSAELAQANASVQQESQARQRSEEELRRVRDELGRSSDERLAELLKADASLQEAVGARQRAEDSLQEYQARLQSIEARTAEAFSARSQAEAFAEECRVQRRALEARVAEAAAAHQRAEDLLQDHRARLQTFEERAAELEKANSCLQEEILVGKQAEEQLRRDKELIGRIVQSAPDGIFAFDRECRLTFWNPVMEQMSGVGREKAVGSFASELFPAAKERGEHRYFAECMEGKRVFVRSALFGALESGQRHQFETVYAPMLGHAAEADGGMAIVREVNERVVVEETELTTTVDQTNGHPRPIRSRLIPLRLAEEFDWLSFN